MKHQIAKIRDQLFPVTDKTCIKANRKANLPFLVSALAYFCLSMDNKIGYVLGVLVAMALIWVAAGQMDSLWQQAKADSRKCKIFYALTTAGICFGAHSYVHRQTAKLMMPQFNLIFLAVGILGAVAAFWFIYVGVRWFWKFLIKSAEGMFRDLTKA